MGFHHRKHHSIMGREWPGDLDAGAVVKLVLAGVVVFGTVKLVREMLSD